MEKKKELEEGRSRNKEKEKAAKARCFLNEGHNAAGPEFVL